VKIGQPIKREREFRFVLEPLTEEIRAASTIIGVQHYARVYRDGALAGHCFAAPENICKVTLTDGTVLP
jgi:hypothetical protein